MKRLVFFLIAFFSLLGSAYSGVCPDKVYIDEPNCRKLCEAVYEKLKQSKDFDKQYKLVSAYQQVSTLPTVSSMCACTFGKKNPITGEYSTLDACYYTVRSVVPGVAVKKKQEDIGTGMPLSDYLLKLFLFDKEVAEQPLPPIFAYSPSGEMVKGMYTLYVKSIKAVSVYVAGLLLTIALGWQLISMLFGNFTQVVRSPGQFFTNLVAGEKLSSYTVVTLSTLFLVMPLNGNLIGLTVKKDAVLREIKAKCEMIKNEMNKEYDECVDSKQDLAALYGCEPEGSGSSVSLLDALVTAVTNPDLLAKLSIGIIADIFSGESFDYSKIQSVLTGAAKASWTCEAVSESECKELVSGLEKEYEKCLDEYEKYRESIPVDLQEVEAPLAVRMIKDSVLWGSKFAEDTVLPVAAGVVKNYIINRYVKISSLAELTSAAGVENVKMYKKAVDKMWNMPVFRVYGSEEAICQGVVDGKPVTIRTCADYYATTPEQRAILLQQNPFVCKDVMVTLQLFCKKLKKQKEIALSVEESMKETEDRIKWLNQVLDKTRDDFGWLSPAIMPFYSIYYEAARFHMNVTDGMAYGKLITERYYRGDDVVSYTFGQAFSNAIGFENSVANFLGKVGNLAKSAVTGVGSFVSEKFKDIFINEDVGDDFAGEINPSLSYVIGRTMVLYSIPPGDKFAQVINDIGSHLEDVMLGLSRLATVYIGIYAGALGVGITALLSFAKPIIAIYLAAKLNEMFLAILPLIVGSFALTIRAIQYFLEVILLVLVSPFYAIAAVTRQKNKVLEFFIAMFKLTFFPIVFLIVAVMTFTAIELGFLFTYTIPVKYVFAFVPVDEIFSGFMAGVIDAVFIIFSSLVCASLAWFVGFSGIDSIIDWVSSIISYTDRKLQGFEQTAKHHVGRLMAKTTL